MNQTIWWIKFLVKPSTLDESTYFLVQIPSNTFNLIFVGSNSQQNLHHYINQDIRWIKSPAKPSTLYLLDPITSKIFHIVGSTSQQNLQYVLDHIPSKTFNITIFESTYLSDQIPCESFNVIFVGSHSQQHLQYWLDRIPSKTFDIIWVNICVGSNPKQNLQD